MKVRPASQGVLQHRILRVGVTTKLIFADNVVAMGGKVVSQEAVAPTDVDMHSVLTRIASAKPDPIYCKRFTAAAAQVSRQAKEAPGLEKVKLMGGTAMLSADFIEAAGPSVIGLLLGNGPIACDPDGACSQFKPSVLEFTSGDPRTFGIGQNPKKIWP
jgi:ABC-type branched-subunit amino acid transport system substrate-binding protein